MKKLLVILCLVEGSVSFAQEIKEDSPVYLTKSYRFEPNMPKMNPTIGYLSKSDKPGFFIFKKKESSKIEPNEIVVQAKDLSLFLPQVKGCAFENVSKNDYPPVYSNHKFVDERKVNIVNGNPMESVMGLGQVEKAFGTCEKGVVAFSSQKNGRKMVPTDSLMTAVSCPYAGPKKMARIRYPESTGETSENSTSVYALQVYGNCREGVVIILPIKGQTEMISTNALQLQSEGAAAKKGKSEPVH